MTIADAWASETTTVTSAKRADRARLAAQVAAFFARGGKIDYRDPVGRQTVSHDWRDFTLGGPAELKRKREKGGKKAQRTLGLARQ